MGRTLAAVNSFTQCSAGVGILQSALTLGELEVGHGGRWLPSSALGPNGCPLPWADEARLPHQSTDAEKEAEKDEESDRIHLAGDRPPDH